MKQTIIALVCVLGIAACQSSHSPEFSPESSAVSERQQPELNLQRLAQLEAALGVQSYTTFPTQKTLSEVEAFYAVLPQKALALGAEQQYLAVMQHNLIAAMVTYHGLADTAHPQLSYYAQEFERLGADNIEVAGALYRALEDKISASAMPTLTRRAKASDADAFAHLRAELLALKE